MAASGERRRLIVARRAQRKRRALIAERRGKEAGPEDRHWSVDPFDIPGIGEIEGIDPLMLGGMGVGAAAGAALAPWTAGLSVPASLAVMTALGLGTGAAERGTRAAIKGTDILEEAGDPLGVGLDLVAPAAGKALGRIAGGLFGKGTRKTVEHLDEVVDARKPRLTPRVPRGDVPPVEGDVLIPPEPGRLDSLRAAFTSPTGLKWAKNQTSRELARRADDFGAELRRIEAHGDRAVSDIFRKLRGGKTQNVREAVTYVLDGQEIPEALGLTAAQRELAEEAAGRMRAEVYEPMADLMDSYGYTVREGKNLRSFHPRRRYTPYIDRNPMNEVNAARTIDDTGRRTMHGTARRVDTALDPEKHLLDAEEIAHAYLQRDAPRVAATYAFGGIEPAMGGAAAGIDDFGKNANRLLAQLGRDVSDGAASRSDYEVARDFLNAVYKFRRNDNGWVDTVRRGIGTGMLGGVARTQLTQASTPLWRHGFANTGRGIAKLLTDRDYRNIVRASGAGTPGVTKLVAGDRTGRVPWNIWRLMEGIEGGLRSVSAASGMEHADELATRVARKGGAASSSLRRELSELLGLDAAEVVDGAGDLAPRVKSLLGRDARVLRDVAQRAADTSQFQAHTLGQTPTWMLDTKAGRLATQFMPFGISASRLAKDELIRPLMKSPSEAGMALLRAAKVLPAIGVGAGLHAASAPLVGDMRPADESLTRSLSRMPGTVLGVAADAPMQISQYGVDDYLLPPSMSGAERLARSLARVQEDPLDLALRGVAMHPGASFPAYVAQNLRRTAR